MEGGGSARAAPHNYSRKQKSLGLLCSNFISLYDRDGIESVGLDDAAARLGVERRRIYDIVNVLESVGVLSRKAKNRYSWIGFSGIPQALNDLKKEEAPREIAGNPLPTKSSCEGVSDDDDEDEEKSTQQSAAESGADQACSASKTAIDAAPWKAKSRVCENRKEKSLGLLTQNFVKLFLTTNMEMISLDEAARLLLGDGDSSQMRNNAAKVRRLYDIANVLSSMNLIEKTQHAESRKPAFRWLGVNVKRPDNGLTLAMAPPTKLNKRAFGMDITNTDFKRSKVVFSAEGKQRKVQGRSDDIKECNLTAQRQLQGSKACVFGPFCPGAAKEEKETEGMVEKGALDWDAVAASFRPQYHNQALNDLFAHYVESWKSWYFELAQGGSTLNDPAILEQLIPTSNRCR